MPAWEHRLLCHLVLAQLLDGRFFSSSAPSGAPSADGRAADLLLGGLAVELGDGVEHRGLSAVATAARRPSWPADALHDARRLLLFFFDLTFPPRARALGPPFFGLR